jgi:hypothetical protein
VMQMSHFCASVAVFGLKIATLVAGHSATTQGCQMLFFKPKIPIWLSVWGSCNGSCGYILWHLVYFTAILNMLWPFGIFCGNWLYSFSRFLVCSTEKNLAALPQRRGEQMSFKWFVFECSRGNRSVAKKDTFRLAHPRQGQKRSQRASRIPGTRRGPFGTPPWSQYYGFSLNVCSIRMIVCV